MKRFLITMLVTFAVTALFGQSNENLYWNGRIKVKMDKKLEWEKKITPHLKTHYPTLKFRVYETLTGENTGTYLISTGPSSYKNWDAPSASPKGEAVRAADAQVLDALCDKVEVLHVTRQDEISNLKPDRKIKFIQAWTYEIEVGSWQAVRAFLGKLQEARKKGGSKADYMFFRPSGSGTNHVYFGVRYFEKWEELDLEEDIPALYDAAHGQGTWSKDWPEYLKKVKSIKVETRVLRTDLSVL